MRIRKSTKRPKRNTKSGTLTLKQQERKDSTRVILISIAMAVIIFVLLLVIASSILDTGETKEVYRASKDIEKGTKITSNNINTYFEKKNYPVDDIPANHIVEPNELLDVYIIKDYVAKDIVTKEGLSKQEDIIAGIKNPIEVSISVSSIDSVVGGIIREGDFVNIYVVEDDKDFGKVATKIIDNCYIVKAMDGSGVEITRDKKDVVTSLFNIIIPMEKEKEFNEVLASGNMRMSKILEPDLSSGITNIMGDGSNDKKEETEPIETEPIEIEPIEPETETEPIETEPIETEPIETETEPTEAETEGE